MEKELNIKSFYLPIIFVIVICLGALIYLNNQKIIDVAGASDVTKIYYVDNISAAHQNLINRFNAENDKNIEVVPVNLPFSKFSTNERKELLARSLRSKSDRIDIFSVDLIWVPRFARWSEPLDLYFPVSERDQILDYALTSCYFQEKLVSVPLYIDIGMMYYRDDLLQAFPNYESLVGKLKSSITWEELIHLKQSSRYQSNPFYLFPARNFEGLICSYMESLVGQYQVHQEASSFSLNTPEAERALQFLVDMVHKYKMTPLDVTQFDDSQNFTFAVENDALFFRGWPGFVRSSRGSPLTAKLQYIKSAPLPHFKGSGPASVYGGWNLMISKFSTKKTAAIEFLKYALKPESQKLLYEEAGYLPVNQAVYQDSLFYQSNPDLDFYLQLLEKGVHRPYLVNYTRISDILSYYVHQAIEKEISVKDALQTASEQMMSQQVIIR